MCYLFLTQMFMFHIVNEFYREEQGLWFYVGLIDFGIVIYQLNIERSQIKQTSFMDYITSIMNIFDIFQYISILFLIFVTLCELKCVD